MVNLRKIKDVDELKARITEAVATIDNAMLERVLGRIGLSA